MTTGMRISRRIIRLVVNQLTFPVMTATRVYYLFIIPLWCIRLSFIITLMYGTPWWYYCDLSACVCDWFLGTHEFCAFNFILKIGCDTRGSITNNIQSKVDFKISMEISVIWQSISSYQKLVKHWSLLE